MKAVRTFVVIASAAALVVIAGATSLLAQVPNFPQGFAQSQLCPPLTDAVCLITVNGGTLDPTGQIIDPAGWLPNVPVESSVLELTQDVGNQRGAVWFNTPQPVTHAWTSVFQFRLSASNPQNHGDGLAFVIQQNGEISLSQAGGFGGGIGYGTRFNEDPCCSPAGPDSGIPNSLAFEIDTYQNSWDLDNQHVAIQSCGVNPNSPNHNDPNCFIARAAILPSINIADGNPHTVRIDYTPPTNCGSDCPNLLVYIDGSTTPTLVTFLDINATLGLDGTSAYVGFTAATRGASETHDILSWTFSPNDTQTQTVTPGQTTIFNFQGGVDNGGYNYNVQLASGSPVTVQVTPILKSQADCDALVQKNPAFVQANPAGAHCIVYHNADGANGDFAVMFEVTCPQLPNSECGTTVTPNFVAELGSDYNFTLAANPGFSKTQPLPGWLKGHGPNSDDPCFPNPDNVTPLFQSDQIDSFSVVNDPTGHTKGSSGGTGSCWAATYNTPGVAPSVAIITPSNSANFAQGSSVASNFTCTAVNAGASSPVGPYLTVPTAPPPGGCTATINSGVPFVSGTPLDTATPGPHTFTATVTDSGSDSATRTVTYNVVAPTDLAILKIGPPKATVGSKITYLIGVGDLGSQNALDVVVNDILPANTTLVSVTANKINCSVTSGRLSCSSASVPCTAGPTVSCAVGTLMPLSWSSLNGVTIKLTVQLGSAWTAGRTVQNTATVSGTNTDPTSGNNSSTASTLVTAPSRH
jgi:uncharacterized repeat protein (TIGR01451 family)